MIIGREGGGQLGRLTIVGFHDQNRDFRPAGPRGGSQPAFAGHQLVSITHGTNDKRLQQAVGAETIGQGVEGFVVEVFPRLKRIAVDQADIKTCGRHNLIFNFRLCLRLSQRRMSRVHSHGWPLQNRCGPERIWLIAESVGRLARGPLSRRCIVQGGRILLGLLSGNLAEQRLQPPAQASFPSHVRVPPCRVRHTRVCHGSGAHNQARATRGLVPPQQQHHAV